jgi:small subunit ribosomal protein S6
VPTNTYETLLILDSNHYARDPSGVSKKIETMVSESGGKILVSRMWMEQRLAYPIDGHQKGTYWLAYFEMEGPDLTKLKRALQISEPVLRELTIKLDPRLVEPILANARGETLVFREPDVEPEVSSDGDEESIAEAVLLD